jgi:hypothetical protein
LAARSGLANVGKLHILSAMRHTLPIAPQFYVTAPQACPYLEGRMERKLFTALQGEHAQRLNDTLSKQGFRRSQNVLPAFQPGSALTISCPRAPKGG